MFEVYRKETTWSWPTINSGVDMSSDTILGVGRLARVAPENRKVSNDPRDGLGKQW